MSINEGNSASPVINKYGAVIGIVKSKIDKIQVSRTDIDNIAYAIPIDKAFQYMWIDVKDSNNA
ncbi:hypothetical protein SD80_014475 [Scytonema tolypothrichoides VB-61278]|nr:hypothetical protein SD80_014475 [Scytonema tolypothrichoides VB-61278]